MTTKKDLRVEPDTGAGGMRGSGLTETFSSRPAVALG